jgi:hypothetical protein
MSRSGRPPVSATDLHHPLSVRGGYGLTAPLLMAER